MHARVLIVEDEKEIADLISLYLTREGIETVPAFSGEEALTRLEKEGPFDLIALDINLPGIDGFETLQKIRRDHTMPVILISARQEDADMIMGFGGGADDYVTKPFSPRVLSARIRAHLNRAQREDGPGCAEAELLRFGDFQLDRRQRRLRRGDEILEMSPREMDLLLFLAENPERPFSPEELYERVWGQSYGDISTVSVHVQRIRKKIETDPSHPAFLQTRYGFGYFLHGVEDHDS